MNECGIVCSVYQHVVQPIMLLLLAIATIWFIMGLVQFISGAKIEERRAKGLRHLDQGLLGMIIMFSAFGIIAMIANTLDDSSGQFDGIEVDNPTLQYNDTR